MSGHCTKCGHDACCCKEMSETPRTDAICPPFCVVPNGTWKDFARELERKNNRLREALERIADNGGIYSAEMTYNGLWCAKMAREALEETK